MTDPILSEYINRMIANDPTLTSLELNFQKIGDKGLVRIARALAINSTVKYVHLRDNNITHIGAMYLTHALLFNTTAVNITLIDNRIGDRGARYMANVIAHNSTIQGIDIGINEIGIQGCVHLLYALQRNTRLKLFCMGDVFDKVNLFAHTLMTHSSLMSTLFDLTHDISLQALVVAVDVNPMLSHISIWNIGSNDARHKSIRERISRKLLQNAANQMNIPGRAFRWMIREF